MIQLLDEYHHYKKELISSDDRAAVYERYIIDLLIESTLPDSQRESSIAYELKHHHSVAQFARILAKKRGLQEDVCVVGALLHDIHVIVDGSYKDHARKSAKIAIEILEEFGSFSEEEKRRIIKIIRHHSDKDVWSNDPYEELGKDADILDSFLYPNAFGFYLKYKKLSVLQHYIKRARLIWEEMSIPIPIAYSVLDNYNETWLDHTERLNSQEAVTQLAFLFFLSSNYGNFNILVPSFCILNDGETHDFFFNNESFSTFSKTYLDVFSSQYTLSEFRIPVTLTLNAQYLEIAESALKNSNGRLLLIWPAINSYELLDIQADIARISQLGIKTV